MRMNNAKTRWRSGVLQAFCIFLGLCLMAPLLYCILVSFMHEPEILSPDLHLWPDEFYLGNYIHVITKTKIFRFMLNSFIVAFGSSIARVLTGCLAAYAFSLMEFRGRNVLFWLVLG